MDIQSTGNLIGKGMNGRGILLKVNHITARLYGSVMLKVDTMLQQRITEIYSE
jgi:hypothetical protein